MKNELDVVRDISAKFDELGIRFMLTGSMALNYYAQPRMTRDINVVVAETAREAVSRESIFNLIHQDSVIKVDCIVRKSSEYRKVELDRRVAVRIAGFRTNIASREDVASLGISSPEWYWLLSAQRFGAWRSRKNSMSASTDDRWRFRTTDEALLLPG